MNPEFPIPITDLDAGGREYTFPVRPAWVRGALEDTDATASTTDGELDVRVSKSGHDIVVRGRLKAELSLHCARCLEPFPIRLDQEITALMMPASEMRALQNGDGERDGASDDLDVMTYSGESIALDEMVRDELVLEIPMIPLCSEDCAGITPPPEAGAQSEEQAIDPRLAPLLRLKTREKKE
ncbi:MAG TPA: DUF177 domain-containing protein [Polyangiaceae bacterium]